METPWRGAERGFAIDPRHVVALNRAVALQRLNRYDEAIADYDAALAIMPEFAQALTNRAPPARSRSLRRGAGEPRSSAGDRAFPRRSALQPRPRAPAFQRYREAIAGYDRALALRPDLTRSAQQPRALPAIAATLRRSTRELRRGARAAVGFAEARFNRGAAFPQWVATKMPARTSSERSRKIPICHMRPARCSTRGSMRAIGVRTKRVGRPPREGSRWRARRRAATILNIVIRHRCDWPVHELTSMTGFRSCSTAVAG